MQEDTTPDPYSLDIIVDRIQFAGDAAAFMQDHPFSTAFLAAVIVIFVVWLINRKGRNT